MVYATVDVAATCLVYAAAYRAGSSKALGYLLLSTAFSMGFLAHPLLAFWIAQHGCENPPDPAGNVMNGQEHAYLWAHVKEFHRPSYQYTAQPTRSYYG